MSAVKRKEATSSSSDKPAKKFKSEKSFDASKSYKSNGFKDGAGYKGKQGNEGPKKTFESKTSAESHAAQRSLARERKLQKPNADSIETAKKIWERLRIKSKIPLEERRKLVAELFEIITGRVKDFVFKHDSVRTVQCAVRYGNLEQRNQIARELKGSYKDLAQSRYAKFLVGKVLVECDKEVRQMVVDEFKGSVRRLINHSEASWILDDTYRGVCTSEQKASLLREWYGPEFSVFKDGRIKEEEGNADLVQILEKNPEKRKPILDHLWSMIDQLVQKKMTGFTMLHDAMLQYSLAVGAPASSEGASEFHELLKSDEEGDLLKNLAFTKSGSRVVTRALAFGNAKDRRNILRVYKEHIDTMAYDPNGLCVILAAYECVDDTVMTSKQIFPELLATKNPNVEERYDSIVQHVNHMGARMALLYPLVGFRLKWPEMSTDNTAQEVTEEVKTLRAETSKKNPETRRKELVKALTADDNTLLATIENRAAMLTETNQGCMFITEVLLSGDGDKTGAMAAVAKLAQGKPSEDGHASQLVPTGKMLKTLASPKRLDPTTKQLVDIEPRLGFTDVLWEQINKHVVEWATGKSSFIVANMAEDEGFKERKKMMGTLKKQRKTLEEAAKTGNKGSKLLLDKM